MNLYTEDFIHYSQKDSEEGIKKYFIAENDEEAYKIVYDWSPTYVDCMEAEEGETADEAEARAIKEITEARGEMNTEYELHDLYYGLTYKGWSLLKEDISEEDISVLETLGILSKD